MDNFIHHFQRYRDKYRLHHDPMQDKMVAALNDLERKILNPSKASFWTRKTKPPKGLYIWGGVGRGKTMIMDLFFDYLAIEQKRRVHFNIFMLDVHNSIASLRMDGKGKDPLPQIAKEIATACRVLCFDEFQVYDIADAMVLSELFKALFVAGVTVIATSNVAPENLYKDGLQRSRFLPFIDVVNREMDVVHIDSPTDYRQQALRENGVYFVHNLASMEHLFAAMIASAHATSQTLYVGERVLPIERAAEGCAWLSFQELCEKPRGAVDYNTLADHFYTVFIHNVPRMGYDRRNELKRFIVLIDTLYDRNIRVVIHAEAAPQDLYHGETHAFEFERTISRLLEMQGEAYLQKTGGSENVKTSP